MTTRWGHIDNLILMKNPTRYKDNWANRCNGCLSPCCFNIGMEGYLDYQYNGYLYDPTHIENDIIKAQKMFTDNFIIMELFGSEKIVTGTRLCPLNVDSKCIIYEDRPTICKIFKCKMACVLS